MIIGPNVPQLGFRVDFLPPRTCALLRRALQKGFPRTFYRNPIGPVLESPRGAPSSGSLYGTTKRSNRVQYQL